MMDSNPYRIVDLVQGSPAWHAWREQGIGASDAPTIMGENPWCSAAVWFERKCGLRGPGSVTRSMALGRILEPVARHAYEIEIGQRMAPVCVQRIDYTWMLASLDGMSRDGGRAVEIKCGLRTYREASVLWRVPLHYFAQLQHILAVTGLAAIDFWSYWPHCPPIRLEVERDEDYIGRLIEVESWVWKKVLEWRSLKCERR